MDLKGWKAHAYRQEHLSYRWSSPYSKSDQAATHEERWKEIKPGRLFLHLNGLFYTCGATKPLADRVPATQHVVRCLSNQFTSRRSLTLGFQ